MLNASTANRWRMFLPALAVMCLTSVAAAQDDEGFRPLFDGESLEGWHVNPEKIGHGTGGHWFVQDGAIVGEQDPPGSGNGGILLTDEQFGDFELLIDAKPDWGVCSGLFVRSNDLGQCFQVLVDYHDAGNVGHIYGEGTGGFTNRPFSIFGVYENDDSDAGALLGLRTEQGDAVSEGFSVAGPDWVRAWKLNDWNTLRVRCVGSPPQITTWLNGVKVTEFDASTFEDPRYDQEAVAELLGDRGSIAVQVHGGSGWPNGATCRWRDVRIKPLD